LFAKDTLDTKITGSKFSNCTTSEFGGAIFTTFVDPSTENPPNVAISDSRVETSKGMAGGAIFAENVNLLLQNSTITRNEASKDSGGGIFVQCQVVTSFQCNFTVSNTQFRDNFANKAAGAIKWNHKKPYLENNEYTNNTAPVFPEISSLPTQIRLRGVT
jgi:hypothetical protein